MGLGNLNPLPVLICNCLHGAVVMNWRACDAPGDSCEVTAWKLTLCFREGRFVRGPRSPLLSPDQHVHRKWGRGLFPLPSVCRTNQWVTLASLKGRRKGHAENILEGITSAHFPSWSEMSPQVQEAT